MGVVQDRLLAALRVLRLDLDVAALVGEGRAGWVNPSAATSRLSLRRTLRDVPVPGHETLRGLAGTAEVGDLGDGAAGDTDRLLELGPLRRPGGRASH